MQHITRSCVCGDAVVHKPTALLCESVAHTVTVAGYTVYVCVSALCDVCMTESPNNYSFLSMGPHCKLYMSVNPHVKKSKVIFPKKEGIQFILLFLGLGTKDIWEI